MGASGVHSGRWIARLLRGGVPLLLLVVAARGGAQPPPPPPNDIYQTGFETGSLAWSNKFPASCDDGFQNGNETAVDCGGSCLLCNGDSCGNDPECKSDFCLGGSCTEPTCSDGFQNGQETGIDCGGPSCLVCDGGSCTNGNQCHSHVCDLGSSTCSAPTCSDLVKNGQETDTDCGGPVCTGCQQGNGCKLDSDCADPWLTAYPACIGGAHCGFGGCTGENYDVDQSTADACEVADSPTNNHSSAHAVSLGTQNCADTPLQMTGTIPSDAQTHNPAIENFVNGSAPDFGSINATGGLGCVNDISFSLTLAGTANPGCYKLTVVTDKNPYSCVGNCLVSCNSMCYTDGTPILIKVERICSVGALPPESPTYTVAGHI